VVLVGVGFRWWLEGLFFRDRGSSKRQNFKILTSSNKFLIENYFIVFLYVQTSLIPTSDPDSKIDG
jgi:hypothetical protein